MLKIWIARCVVVMMLGGPTTMLLTASKSDDTADARARQRASEANQHANELAAEQEAARIQAVAPLAQPVAPKPHIEPTPPVVVNPTPAPAPSPGAIPEGYELYYEQVCDGVKCVLVPRLRLKAVASKPVISVLTTAEPCPNPDCTCNPCECGDGCACAPQGGGEAVEVYAAPRAMDFQGGQPVRNAGRVVVRGAARVATVPVRVVQRFRENKPARTFFANGGFFRRGCCR